MSSHRLIFCCLVTLVLSPAAASAATTIAFSQPAAQAPMDRYFGKLALSPLGIENTVNLVNDRIARKEIDSAHAVLELAFVEDAIRDWQTKFPRDTWLPKTVMSLKQSYRAFGDETGRYNEHRIDTWLLLRYPQSPEARTVIATAAADSRKAAPAAR